MEIGIPTDSLGSRPWPEREALSDSVLWSHHTFMPTRKTTLTASFSFVSMRTFGGSTAWIFGLITRLTRPLDRPTVVGDRQRGPPPSRILRRYLEGLQGVHPGPRPGRLHIRRSEQIPRGTRTSRRRYHPIRDRTCYGQQHYFTVNLRIFSRHLRRFTVAKNVRLVLIMPDFLIDRLYDFSEDLIGGEATRSVLDVQAHEDQGTPEHH